MASPLTKTGYLNLLGDDLTISRFRVTLDELLGDGQFGNVYRGTYFETDVSVFV